tara:strand:+ start:200 stop:439 length:240 start_codon:yes stop_codon:yes gene_type:complete
MMPYTCIIQNNKGELTTRLIYGAHRAPWTAEKTLKEENPGCKMIAAVPGNHMNNVWLNKIKKTKDTYVDLWDLDSYEIT